MERKKFLIEFNVKVEEKKDFLNLRFMFLKVFLFFILWGKSFLYRKKSLRNIEFTFKVRRKIEL